MSCGARAGLLVLRACGQPAMGFCGSCGTPLCAIHIGGGMCPDCMVVSGNAHGSEDAQHAAARNDYYNSYGPQQQFGDSNYFSSGDRAAVAGGAAAFGPAGDDYDAFDT